jgi:trehalose 6-phosphate phosphatase
MTPHNTYGPALEAVLLDMDGVVTDTAQAHAAAWKEMFDEFLRQHAKARKEVFQPFDGKRDYLQYVDGKPRHDGVIDFLLARGIELPYGNEDDDPQQQTVCGLANLKNRLFNDWLQQSRVRPFPGTLKLLRDLRRLGIPVAVFSASRNAAKVLENAGVSDLFDTCVDGGDLARLGLPGKPDPAVLHEAVKQLGVQPARTAVIEDAVAGVEAGAAGAFGLVIGVDRGDHADALRTAGADLVINDLSEIRIGPDRQFILKTLDNLPLARERKREIRRLLSDRSPVVFLDYDGTLTPIVTDHTKALLDDAMGAAVSALAERCPVAVVSGRDLAMLRKLVAIDSLYYAGSHGFEIAGPKGQVTSMERGVEYLPLLDEAEQELRRKLAEIAGHSVERKRFSVAVHYRQVGQDRVEDLKAIVDDVLEQHPQLLGGRGKKVLEILPDLDWNKGEAVKWLLEQLQLDRPDVLPIYMGDDITDEYAFRALAENGLTIVVRGEDQRPTAADYAVADTEEVRGFLAWLTGILGEPTVSGEVADDSP